MEKMANHPGGGIALVFARTETKWFQRFVLNHPNISAVVFREGRLKFHRANGDVGDAPLLALRGLPTARRVPVA